MATANIRRIWETVDIADVAVRTASQLRLRSKGHELTDTEAVHRAREFVVSAFDGGQFISGRTAQFSGTTLSPLNWATRAVSRHEGDGDVNYEDILAFLERLTATLETACAGGEVGERDLVTAAHFFDELGKMIGSQADTLLRRRSAHQQALSIT